MRRSIICLLIILLCTTGSLSQSTRGKRSAAIGMKPGYYFTIGLCHACAYFGWHEDAIKGFRAKGIRAAVGGDYVSGSNRNSNLPFAPIRAFKWERSGKFWAIDLYVGPFASEETALHALDDFPSVLAVVQKGRSRMEDSSGGWPISPNERVSRTDGNNYGYGFFFIQGYRLLR